jgi:hypothetical protein
VKLTVEPSTLQAGTHPESVCPAANVSLMVTDVTALELLVAVRT